MQLLSHRPDCGVKAGPSTEGPHDAGAGFSTVIVLEADPIIEFGTSFGAEASAGSTRATDADSSLLFGTYAASLLCFRCV